MVQLDCVFGVLEVSLGRSIPVHGRERQSFSIWCLACHVRGKQESDRKGQSSRVQGVSL